MFRRVLAWLAARLGIDREPDGEEGGSGFVPSPLDRSVRYAHGGNDAGERALSDVRERAKSLEKRRRED